MDYTVVPAEELARSRCQRSKVKGQVEVKAVDYTIALLRCYKNKELFKIHTLIYYNPRTNCTECKTVKFTLKSSQ